MGVCHFGVILATFSLPSAKEYTFKKATVLVVAVEKLVVLHLQKEAISRVAKPDFMNDVFN